jgi:formyltetrahydrofolate hydrolase
MKSYSNYTIKTKQNIISVNFYNQVFLKDILFLSYQILKCINHKPEYNILVKLNDAELCFENSNLKQFVGAIAGLVTKKNKSRRLAVVISTPDHAVKSFMLKSYCKQLPLNIEVFSTIEAAKTFANPTMMALDYTLELS